MPICYVTVSSKVGKKDTILDKVNEIRDIIALGLDSKSRLLDRDHIAIRIQESSREFMLADIELDIFAQFFFRRYFSRDKRSNMIAKSISELLNIDCASWINLCQVGYSRHTATGKDYYSVKEDDAKVLEKRKSNKQS